ncbi:hypothetical protein L9F63_011805, partial [Diploptera punctata]
TVDAHPISISLRNRKGGVSAGTLDTYSQINIKVKAGLHATSYCTFCQSYKTSNAGSSCSYFQLFFFLNKIEKDIKLVLKLKNVYYRSIESSTIKQTNQGKSAN